MNAPARIFKAEPATRRHVPLLIGLMGPPGGGKTLSSLRLAAGMRTAETGPPVLIDTERRSRKHADAVQFDVVDMDPPFAPTDFLAAIRQQVERKPCAIIVDSMSDEHEGPGGVLDQHDRYLDAKAGEDWSKRERMGQAAWIAPKRQRIEFIGGINRILTPLIFCFRSREKVKQLKDDRGKTVPTNIGHQPIAPVEIISALDLTCLLPSRSNGTPVWSSDKIGEDYIVKSPSFLRQFVTEGRSLDEATGKLLADWARGDVAAEPAIDPLLADLVETGDARAVAGLDALGQWWKEELTAMERATLGTARLAEWKGIASQARPATTPGDRHD